MTSMVERRQLLLGPSGSLWSMCWWGTLLSSRSRKSIPTATPAAAGINASFPISADMSMAGMRRDHTEAATMTPEANPKSTFWTRGGILSLRIRKTQAAPSVVPKNGIRIPISTLLIYSSSYLSS